VSSVIGQVTGNTSNTASSFNTFNGIISTTQLYTDNAEKLKKFRERAHFASNSLLAFCCQNFIMIVDSESMQWVQSLDAHRAPTTAVQWCPMARRHGVEERGNTSILASGDKKGVIIIWEVKGAKRIAVFQEEGKKNAILSLKWIDNDNQFLLTLTSGSLLSLWNVKTKQKVWKKEIEDPIISVSLNPFVKSSATLPTENGWIYFINGIYTT
jgi:WD40 repeat protein